MDEQPLQHHLDVVRLAEHLLEPRASPAGAHDDEIPLPHVPEALPVEHDRDVRHEERLADDELAAPRHLDDEAPRSVSALAGDAALALLAGALNPEETADREAGPGRPE